MSNVQDIASIVLNKRTKFIIYDYDENKDLVTELDNAGFNVKDYDQAYSSNKHDSKIDTAWRLSIYGSNYDVIAMSNRLEFDYHILTNLIKNGFTAQSPLSIHNVYQRDIDDIIDDVHVGVRLWPNANPIGGLHLGRGVYFIFGVSHDEIESYRREGLVRVKRWNRFRNLPDVSRFDGTMYMTEHMIGTGVRSVVVGTMLFDDMAQLNEYRKKYQYGRMKQVTYVQAASVARKGVMALCLITKNEIEKEWRVRNESIVTYLGVDPDMIEYCKQSGILFDTINDVHPNQGSVVTAMGSITDYSLRWDENSGEGLRRMINAWCAERGFMQIDVGAEIRNVVAAYKYGSSDFYRAYNIRRRLQLMGGHDYLTFHSISFYTCGWAFATGLAYEGQEHKQTPFGIYRHVSNKKDLKYPLDVDEFSGYESFPRSMLLSELYYEHVINIHGDPFDAMTPGSIYTSLFSISNATNDREYQMGIIKRLVDGKLYHIVNFPNYWASNYQRQSGYGWSADKMLYTDRGYQDNVFRPSEISGRSHSLAEVFAMLTPVYDIPASTNPNGYQNYAWFYSAIMPGKISYMFPTVANSQSYHVKSMTAQLRKMTHSDSRFAHRIRRSSLVDHYNVVNEDDDSDMTGVILVNGEEIEVYTSGHLINMLITSTIFPIDILAYLEYARINSQIMVKASYVRNAFMECENCGLEYRDEDDLGLWHTYYDYESAILAYPTVAIAYGMPVNEVMADSALYFLRRNKGDFCMTKTWIEIEDMDIVFAFPGLGKTYLAEHNDSFVDVDGGTVRNELDLEKGDPAIIEEVIVRIKKELKEGKTVLNNEPDIFDVVTDLTSKDKAIVVIPDDMSEIVRRIKDRGDNEFANMMRTMGWQWRQDWIKRADDNGIQVLYVRDYLIDHTAKGRWMKSYENIIKYDNCSDDDEEYYYRS
jgi:hypothetical protein